MRRKGDGAKKNLESGKIRKKSCEFCPIWPSVFGGKLQKVERAKIKKGADEIKLSGYARGKIGILYKAYPIIKMILRIIRHGKKRFSGFVNSQPDTSCDKLTKKRGLPLFKNYSMII
ncbi:MAG: hypothetical protein PHD67_02450 [Oscillospiraceae bacterium]|nr:hypothetical protein [Oscillospiraceae bacterium]